MRVAPASVDVNPRERLPEMQLLAPARPRVRLVVVLGVFHDDDVVTPLSIDKKPAACDQDAVRMFRES